MPRSTALLLGLLASVALLPACKRQHYPASSSPELGYPTCASPPQPPLPAARVEGEAPTPALPTVVGRGLLGVGGNGGSGGNGGAASAPGTADAASPGSAPLSGISGEGLGVRTTPELLVAHTLRSGQADTRMPIVEHYRIERRGCLTAVITRQEWPMQIADVEALYDENLLPLRVWRRWTLPGSMRPDGNADFKRIELRTPEISIKHRDDKGAIDHEVLRWHAKPKALIGPGRGIISLWLRRAKLAPGQKVREPALDFRGVEKLADVTLARLPDQHVAGLGRTVRVYTFMGRETLFADDDDNVIGDLAGLVLDEKAPGPPPRPAPTFEPLDPVRTP